MIQIKTLLAVCLATLLMFGFTTSKKITPRSENNSYFTIEIEQDGQIVPQKNNTITLKKKPFKYKVTMKGIEDVFVSASWGKFYYDYPLDKNIFECDSEGDMQECRFFMGKVGAQTKFNVDKEIMVGDGSYMQCWFYSESIPFHRFDEGVSLEDGKVKAEMTVENIYDCDLRDKRLENSKHEYKIEEIDKDIYMVFASAEYIKEKKAHKETQREIFVIRFK